MAFEVVEAARWVHFLKRDGVLLVNTTKIPSLPVLIGAVNAPTGLLPALQSEGALLVDAENLARFAGTVRAANLVLMGALSVHLQFEESVWRDVIAARVPELFVDVNVHAFELGRVEGQNVAKAGEGR